MYHVGPVKTHIRLANLFTTVNESCSVFFLSVIVLKGSVVFCFEHKVLNYDSFIWYQRLFSSRVAF